jgi:exosortase A-associated hydrolase 1
MPVFKETPITYSCQKEEVAGILHVAEEQNSDTGVLIIVGGPQYRIGSHRLFVKLARFLAKKNIHCFRFDLRGMGDSSGFHPGFNQSEKDIQSAICVFKAQLPQLNNIILWGLCDGAIAASLALNNPLVKGACLINPWVNTAQSEAKAYINHYYLNRLINKTFWIKLFSFKINVFRTIFEVIHKVSVSKNNSAKESDLDTILLNRIDSSHCPILFIISENDITGQAFLTLLNEPSWRKLIKLNKISSIIIKNADHTFSSHALTNQLLQESNHWITQHIIENKKGK